MASNRIYEAETCPACDMEFYPHDNRQIYCTPQCRINYFNDQRKVENSERYKRKNALQNNDKKIEVLFNSHFFKNGLIEETVLLNLEIDFSICFLEKNLDTGRLIRWFHTYGLELVDKPNRLYTIHHRTK